MMPTTKSAFSKCEKITQSLKKDLEAYLKHVETLINKKANEESIVKHFQDSFQELTTWVSSSREGCTGDTYLRTLFTSLSERRDAELQTICEDIKTLTALFTAAYNNKCEALANAAEVESKRSALEVKNEELCIALERDQKLTEANNALLERVQALNAKLLAQRKSESTMAQNYQLELQAKAKLVELYKREMEDAKATSQGLIGALCNYQSFIATCKDLIAQNVNNDHLELYINAIIQELEEKTPVLKMQEEIFGNAVKSIASLCRQNQQLVEENRELKNDVLEAEKVATLHKESSGRMRQTIRDLSQQICFLVKTVGEATDGSISVEGSMNSSLNGSCGANEVISKKLVSFRDIQDLQATNQKLLAVVRELSQKQEQIERSQQEIDIPALQEQVYSLQYELAASEDAVTQQSKIIEQLVKLGDLPREMHQKSSHEVPLQRPSHMSAPVPPQSSQSSVDVTLLASTESVNAEEQLHELQNEYDEFRQDKDFDFVSSQLLYVIEEYNILKTKMSLQEHKLSALEKVCTIKWETLVKHKDCVEAIRKETFSAQADVLQSLKEYILLRVSEARLKCERESNGLVQQVAVPPPEQATSVQQQCRKVEASAESTSLKRSRSEPCELELPTRKYRLLPTSPVRDEVAGDGGIIHMIDSDLDASENLSILNKRICSTVSPVNPSFTWNDEGDTQDEHPSPDEDPLYVPPDLLLASIVQEAGGDVGENSGELADEPEEVMVLDLEDESADRRSSESSKPLQPYDLLSEASEPAASSPHGNPQNCTRAHGIEH